MNNESAELLLLLHLNLKKALCCIVLQAACVERVHVHIEYESVHGVRTCTSDSRNKSEETPTHPEIP